ncbi:MAG TPA: hemerythrin domain-containing protein [Chloroflexota bacterium]|nr:hemerythrin domain-containing protein [Chloroflexota bacterium]
MTTMQPLHEEHQTLLPHIEALRTAAESLDAWDARQLREALAGAREFLRETLMPHAAAEEDVLYREVERYLGSPDATRTMRRDHEEVRTLLGDLESLHASLPAAGLTGDVKNEARRVLYGLYALLRVHFAKEEEVYLPILEAHLDESGAQALFQRMEHAAHEAHAHLSHPAA